MSTQDRALSVSDTEEVWRSLCSQISIGGAWSVKHTELFLRGKGMLYLLQKAGTDVLSSLVAFSLVKDFSGTAPSPKPLPLACFSPSIYGTFFFWTLQFQCSLHLAYFVPQDLYMFCCVHRIELTITRIIFTKLFSA